MPMASMSARTAPGEVGICSVCPWCLHLAATENACQANSTRVVVAKAMRNGTTETLGRRVP